MNLDTWDKATWDKIWKKNMAIVCTADILKNCLTLSYISMDRINLLIFDEAHHSKKNHAYARIIKDFYLDQPAESRPRIFGMTASPVDAKTDPVQAARELETILHSRIATTQNLALLRNCISRPEEFVVQYDVPPRNCMTPLYAQLEGLYGNVPYLARFFGNAKSAAVDLGPWCADEIWKTAFTPDEVQKLERAVEIPFSTTPAGRAAADLEIQRIRDVRKIIDEAAETAHRPRITKESLSSKVYHLRELLVREFEKPTDTRCIVFVKRRSTARLLTSLLKFIGTPHMRHDALIGSRPGDVGDPTVSVRSQLLTLTKFRKGDLNLLFATSVAEEGLDIPLCNSIIRFDQYETLIQYIQSRGRARHAHSRYIHMLEKDNPAHLQALRDVHQAEAAMQRFCQSLPSDRILKGDEDVNVEHILRKEKNFRIYKEKETGAKLTYWSAPQILSQFVDSLPHDAETGLKPNYIVTIEGRLYRSEVLLPRNSPIHSVIGRVYARKAVAKGSAAFEACLRLREKGYLDKHLRSTLARQLPEMRNARLAITVKKTNEYDMKLKPEFWETELEQQATELHATVIDLADTQATGRPQAAYVLLTKNPLPNLPGFPIYPRPGFRCDVVLSRLEKSFVVDKLTIELLTSFTLRIFKDLFNKTFEEDGVTMPYWLAPAQSQWTASSPVSAVVDWSVVENVFRREKMTWSINLRDVDIVDKFIVDPGSGGIRYFTSRVMQEMAALDPVPDGCVSHKNHSNVLQYSSSLWKNSRTRANFDETQPVLLAYQIPHRRNWLDDWNDEEKRARTKAYICLEPLIISSIPANVAEMGFLFPSIIWRMDSYLIAIEACNGLGLTVQPLLALEAMTKDSDNTEEHSVEQISFQRGMGRNYERLEFIGDSFLKMATSISLYAQNANDDEFESHVKRMVMICNRNLCNTALELNISEYIRSQTFSRRTWYPPGLKLVGGKGVNEKKSSGGKHRLGDKTIADVCEAIIGAALLSQRETNEMDEAVKAVTKLVKNPDHDVQQWDDYYQLYKLPAYQTADCTAAQQNLADQIAGAMGYRFKYPRLLQSALTHPSYPKTWGGVPCYQRLEFLGDSLLDMACINFLFFGNPDQDPQWLTEHKMAMVANKFLGALCVRLQFHKHLRANENAFLFQIKDYVDEITEAEAAADGAPDYWIRTKDPPKCLPDIVEAYLGAVFVDSCFQYQVVEDFFERHVRPYFLDMTLYDSFANAHPTTYLAHLMDLTFHCNHYRILADELVPGEAADQGTQPIIVAVVMVHLKVVADSEGTSSRYAKVRASQRALAKLEQLSPKEFKERFGCDCRTKAYGEASEDEAGTAI